MPEQHPSHDRRESRVRGHAARHVAGRPHAERAGRGETADRGGAKPGSRSEGHRGWRPADAERPTKRRWSSEDKRARAAGARFGEDSAHRVGRTERADRDGGADRAGRRDRPVRAERPSRGSREEWAPRGARSARPARGERPNWEPPGARPAKDGRARTHDDRTGEQRRDQQPPRGGRAWSPRRDQPSELNDRRTRTHRWARDDRPARDPRPKRGDRLSRDDRPARDHRPARGDHPARDHRPTRDDRPARTQRSAKDDRPTRDHRPIRDDRQTWEPRNGFARDDRRGRTDRTASDRLWSDRSPGDRTTRARADRDDTAAPRTAFLPPADVVHGRLEAATTAADAGVGMDFGDLGLGDNLVRRLTELGASEPFPIQAATIPEVLAGRDVLGRGRTGSGKTIAFGAPLVERLLRLHRARHPEGTKGRAMGRSPRALILAPTRELAQQIDRTVQPLARSVGLFTIAIVGGVPYQRQRTGLQRGVDIVIGTPGRIQDLVDRGELDLGRIEISVLDEADHMCDLGFLEPVQQLLRRTPDGSQRLLFSATLDRAVESLVAEFLTEPSVHEVADEDQASSTIEHRVLVIDGHTKRDVLKELVAAADRSIVFSRTRVFAEDVATILDDAGIPAVSMHGDLNQAKRNRSLDALARGRVRALVATDVAARGIHVDDVDLVIQADMPDDHKTYLHRAGRTGRAGAVGTVVTVIPAARRRRMTEILETVGIEAVWEDRSTPRPARERPAPDPRGRRGPRDRAPRIPRSAERG